MSKKLEAFNEIIDKFAEQMIRANKEELTAINKTNAIEYLYRTPQVRLLHEALQRLEAIDNAKPSEASIDTATEMLLTELEMLSDCAVAIEEEPSSNWIEYAKTVAELDLKLHFAYLDIKQALLKAQEQEKVLEILKPLCEVVETPVKKYRYLKINGVVVYTFKSKEEFDLLKRYCDEQDN